MIYEDISDIWVNVSIEEKKFPPLHVLYVDISDIWVNVSITVCQVLR